MERTLSGVPAWQPVCQAGQLWVSLLPVQPLSIRFGQTTGHWHSKRSGSGSAASDFQHTRDRLLPCCWSPNSEVTWFLCFASKKCRTARTSAPPHNWKAWLVQNSDYLVHSKHSLYLLFTTFLWLQAEWYLIFQNIWNFCPDSWPRLLLAGFLSGFEPRLLWTLIFG